MRRTLLAIITTVLISQYAIAQDGAPPAPGRGPGGGGRGAGGARGAGGGRGAAAPAPPADPGFECFATEETPEFPLAALQTHVDGTVYVRALLTAQATVDKIDSQVASSWGTGPKLLTPAVEKAVRASKFKTECAGKTVAVVYRYELQGAPIANPKPATRTEFNIMFIDSAPATMAAKSAATK